MSPLTRWSARPFAEYSLLRADKESSIGKALAWIDKDRNKSFR
jgi:hypothetical protein